MSFSERYGFKPVREFLQIESMDTPLRNSLWNVITVVYWNSNDHRISITSILQFIWVFYLRKTLDSLSNHERDAILDIREYFFGCKWFEVYDFIESIGNDRRKWPTKQFRELCNTTLENHMSGYRFIGNTITRITDSEEVTEIESALQLSGTTQPAKQHIQRALELLSDRASPDYRNSIKESISAVEAIGRSISKDPHATLGKTLQSVVKETGLHKAFRSALDSLYGYTSDEGGIRHALSEDPNSDFEEAKFMLVICSAFVNYLVAKAQKAGVEL
jgi:hypothetical protein